VVAVVFATDKDETKPKTTIAKNLKGKRPTCLSIGMGAILAKLWGKGKQEKPAK
jgi:hypothetical protein